MRTILNAGALLILTGCGGPHLPQASPQSAAIGIAVQMGHGLLSSRPDVVYFVRLADGQDPYRAGRVIPSNRKRGHYFYLLNAPPGRYSAVAAFDRSTTGGVPPRTRTITTMFGDSLRRVTEVIVEPGSIVFMGDLVIDQSLGLTETDSIQMHLVEFVAPGLAQRRGLARVLSAELLYRGALHELHLDAEAESEFLAAARVDLASGGWIAAIDRRLAELRRR